MSQSFQPQIDWLFGIGAGRRTSMPCTNNNSPNKQNSFCRNQIPTVYTHPGTLLFRCDGYIWWFRHPICHHWWLTLKFTMLVLHILFFFVRWYPWPLLRMFIFASCTFASSWRDPKRHSCGCLWFHTLVLYLHFVDILFILFDFPAALCQIRKGYLYLYSPSALAFVVARKAECTKNTSFVVGSARR